MPENSNDVYALLLVLFGAVVIGRQAALTFNQPLEIDFRHRFKILNKVQVRALTSDRVYSRGRFIYVSLYLIAYLLLLFFWDVLAAEVADGPPTVGDQGDIPFDSGAATFYLDREGAARPIYIATVLIGFLSVGSGKPYERIVRRFAHARAGIPDNIYIITGRLDRFLAKNLKARKSETFLKKYKDVAATFGSFKPEADDDEDIQRSLARIDLLRRAASEKGDQLSVTWTLRKMKEVEPLLSAQEEKLQELEAQIQHLTAEHDAVRALKVASSEQADNLMGVFAVMYLKEGGSDYLSAAEPTASVLKGIQVHERDFHTFVVGLAAPVALFVTFPLIYLVYLYFLVPQGKCTVQWLSLCNRDHMDLALREAFFFWISYGVLFLTVSALAVLARKVRWESGNWLGLSISETGPIYRYLSVLLFPASVAIFGYSLITFADSASMYLRLEGNWLENIDYDIAVIGNVKYFVHGALSSILLGFAILLICDLHDRLTAQATIMIGVLASFVLGLIGLFFFAYAEGSSVQSLRESLNFFLFVATYLLTFSVLAEVSERFFRRITTKDG